MSLFLLLLVALTGIHSSWCRFDFDSVHTIPLGSEATFHWRVDLIKELIVAEVHFIGKYYSWFAIGFSDYGELKPADYCILWTDWHGHVDLKDSWADIHGKLHLDTQQDCKHFEWKRSGNMTKFTFSRKFDTCDEHDYIIERGTTHLVWLKGHGPLSSVLGLQVSDAKASGMSRTELTRVPHKKPKFPNAWQLELLTHQVQVPHKETTYWCRVHKLPAVLRQKHHILQFGPAIQTGNEHLVHHMEVFHCFAPADVEIPMYDGPCDGADRPEKTQICRKVLAAWAMGADAFVYPEKAGLAIGGVGFNPYVMLEVHYNNPELHQGIIDSSGIQFVLTKTLRKYDAGVIELGLTYIDKMAIPPREAAFTLSGHCITECTGIGLPPQQGIHVFGSQLHTHLTGTKIVTRHVRDGKELPYLNYDNHYSTHFQEIRLLPEPVLVLPGDSLITTCTYNTKNRENVTLGGFAISDEMCVNYIHYYPNTQLEVCKSAISDNALRTYFDFMRDWEHQNISSEKGTSSNYKSIEWNKIRVSTLHDLYEVAPLDMECAGSDGSRLPGLWDNIELTPVTLPLPPPTRNCPELSFH